MKRKKTRDPSENNPTPHSQDENGDQIPPDTNGFSELLRNEMEEKAKRLAKNRENVRTCRARKKVMVRNLQDDIENLSNENIVIKNENKCLKQRIHSLETAILDHTHAVTARSSQNISSVITNHMESISAPANPQTDAYLAPPLDPAFGLSMRENSNEEYMSAVLSRSYESWAGSLYPGKVSNAQILHNSLVSSQDPTPSQHVMASLHLPSREPDATIPVPLIGAVAYRPHDARPS
eukprot:CAMPEP_0194330552 /NCGR_PEP_ID=MMETSP0171-20130528/52405_1 /TAXON_ID=218684 /ORGANISM="Corethron pennatum, Strain L29A3" /LENGTH=235 /DNA_ID=CAMNT_0039091687 /DNA_START=59 /DNA_END=766 /DNA_ORIENTATION=+